MIFILLTSMFFLLKRSSLCQLHSSENFGELAYTVANLHSQNHFKVWILYKFSSDFLSEIRGERKFAFSPRQGYFAERRMSLKFSD